jgi:hypothetical protein
VKAKRGPTVMVSGKSFPTVIDEQGVQRFKMNAAVRWCVDHVSLNALWIAGLPKNDVRALYRMMGYSVCGYADVFPGDKIENPTWRAEWELRKSSPT